MHLEKHGATESRKNLISALKTELSILVNEFEQLINVTCKNIEIEYLKAIGQRKLEMLYLDFEARRLKRKIELINMCINSGAPVNMQEIQTKMDIELSEWKEKYQDFAKKYNYALESEKYVLSIEDSKELKRIFRFLSKKLHTDINPNLPEKFKFLWLRTYDAYKNGDLEELKAIEQILFADEIPAEYDFSDDMELQKVQLEKAVNHYIQKIEKVKNEYPYTMLKILEDEELLNKEKKYVEEFIKNLKQKIANYNIILNNMGYNENVKFGLN